VILEFINKLKGPIWSS